MQQEIVKRKRGRPATFDYEIALEKAMQTFWAYGFEGTSMSTLTDALSMNKASIYAVFGSKEDLFNKALDRYVKGPAAFVTESLNEATAVKVVEKFLMTSARSLTNKNHPCGCMVIQSALTCSLEAKHIHDRLAGYRAAYEAAFAKRFERAIAENDLPRDANCRALAKLMVTVQQGMSVQASSGANEQELLLVADLVVNQFKQMNRPGF